jgi:hypothetical protein
MKKLSSNYSNFFFKFKLGKEAKPQAMPADRFLATQRCRLFLHIQRLSIRKMVSHSN